MSRKTDFQTTETLLFERDALHGLVDTLWKDNVLNRTGVYHILSETLGKPDVHISDMSSEEMQKVVERMQPMVAKHLNRICHCCKHGYKSTLGLYRCGLTGNFSLTWKEPCNALAGDDF